MSTYSARSNRGGILAAIRDDAGGTYAGSDGQLVPLTTDANGYLRVNATVSLSIGAEYAEDAAHTTGDTGSFVLAVRQDTRGTLVSADGDYSPFAVNASGDLYVYDSQLASLIRAEDAASADGHNGMPVLAVRQDTLSSSTGTDGDYAFLKQNASGELYVTINGLVKSEDAAHSGGDTGFMPLAVRQDTLSALAGSSGDYIPLSTDALGAIYTHQYSQRGSSVVDTARNAYSGTNVTTGAWVELIASTSADCNSIEIFDSSGETLELGTGAAAAEARLLIVVPGGNGRVPVRVASGTRISIRAISATASVGEIDLNLYS